MSNIAQRFLGTLTKSDCEAIKNDPDMCREIMEAHMIADQYVETRSRVMDANRIYASVQASTQE